MIKNLPAALFLACSKKAKISIIKCISSPAIPNSTVLNLALKAPCASNLCFCLYGWLSNHWAKKVQQSSCDVKSLGIISICLNEQIKVKQRKGRRRNQEKLGCPFSIFQESIEGLIVILCLICPLLWVVIQNSWMTFREKSLKVSRRVKEWE